MPTAATPPLVLHIPHASRLIPPEVRGQFVLDDSALERELLAMTDAHTDRLFAGDAPCWPAVVFPVSRLVVDPERFPRDEDEPMSRCGMGLVYILTSSGQPLRRPLADAERSELIARHYALHHAALTAAVAAAVTEHARCLIVDCHSFPSRPLPYESDQAADRPDICLGTDPDHTPPAVVAQLADSFGQAGLRVAVNRPFGGTLVPASFYRKRFWTNNWRVASVMIEVNRALYMDETTGGITVGFSRFQGLVARAIGAIKEVTC